MNISKGLPLEPSCCLLHKDGKNMKNEGCKRSNSKVWGFDGCGYEDYSLLESPPPKSLVCIYMTTQCLVPEDSSLKGGFLSVQNILVKAKYSFI
jgi:hypothetical protein